MMKKSVVFLCVCCAMISFSSCRSAKEVVPVAALNGEWDIMEINGAAVTPGAGKELPYIGFDAQTGRVHGESGCNRMMGSFDTKAKTGVMDLSNIAGSRMMCPDMTLEQNVLNALKLVKGYKKVNGHDIALTNANNRPVIVLTPRQTVSLLSSLEGEWKITKIKRRAVPTELDKEPFLSFDTKTKRLHGNAGCNMINGGVIAEDGKPHSISFPAVAATMMACPDMNLEKSVLEALNEVKSFETFDDKTAGLYAEDGTQVLWLKKK